LCLFHPLPFLCKFSGCKFSCAAGFFCRHLSRCRTSLRHLVFSAGNISRPLSYSWFFFFFCCHAPFRRFFSKVFVLADGVPFFWARYLFLAEAPSPLAFFFLLCIVCRHFTPILSSVVTLSWKVPVVFAPDPSCEDTVFDSRLFLYPHTLF